MSNQHTAIIIGAGPAGLMAAERLSEQGFAVDVYDAMPSVARKLLIAGVGGLNLTHSEAFDDFVARYRERSTEVATWLQQLDADGLRAWAAGLGIDTFVGSSGRVFPTDMKAAPLLRHWLRRLKAAGVRIHLRHRWLGFGDDGSMRLLHADAQIQRRADVCILALGGGSWSRLGSDGQWMEILAARTIPLAPLRPANCGFEVEWSSHFRQRHAGHAVKPVRLSIESNVDDAGMQGEFVVTEHGVEGSLIYAHAAILRDRIAADGVASIHLDLAPGRDQARLLADLSKPRGSRSVSEHLRRHAGIDGVKAGMLYEVLGTKGLGNIAAVAATIKRLPLQLLRPRPIDEAISTAGGVQLQALDRRLMLRQLPGVFCAGEMLDWEAPTGGYLLTACFASGRVAGDGAAAWCRENKEMAEHS